jgi:hypothetical protein
MDTRQHDMTGSLTRQLNNAFAQVGIDDFYPVLMKELIESAFLGQHGLALDHLIDPMFLQERKDDLIVFHRVGSPVYSDAVPNGGFLELSKVSAEVRQHIVFYPGSGVPEYFPIGNLRSGYVALFSDPPKGLVMPFHSRFVLVECGRKCGMIFVIGAHALI